MTYQLTRLTFEEASAWDQQTASYQGRELFHRKAWLDYLAATRSVDIHLWRITSNRHTVGYFCAGLVRKGPFRILGSPLKGWGTNCMGPITNGNLDQDGLLDALDELAAAEGIALTELEQPMLRESALDDHQYRPTSGLTYLVRLAPDNADEMWRTLKSTARNRIRKATAAGLVVEDTEDPSIADEFYAQYSDLMRRKGLVPPYPREYPRLLFQHLKNADLLFALRVQDRDGNVLATGLFPHDDRTLYFWGGASRLEGHPICPNDFMHWSAMRLAAERGLRIYNMCGDGHFKGKFGGHLVALKRWQKCYWRSARWALRGYEIYLQKRMRLHGWLQRVVAPVEGHH